MENLKYSFSVDDVTETNNNGLEYTVAVLEEIYTNPAFPPKAPVLSQSLRDSGKSRLEVSDTQGRTNVVIHIFFFLSPLSTTLLSAILLYATTY